MTVDAETLRGWMEAGRPLTVLDVRPRNERAEWSIPGSLHVDAYDALWARDPGALDSISLPLDRPVVTVCAAGKTSLLAAEVLRARGHTAYSLAGGMGAWSGAWNIADVPSNVEGIEIVQVRRTGKGCLSYIVGSGPAAAVIDPSVDSEVYRTIAGGRGWKIVSVIETHVHADHLSRALALCRATGAVLSMPEQQRVGFPHVPIRDGQKLGLGSFTRLFTALRTPGSYRGKHLLCPRGQGRFHRRHAVPSERRTARPCRRQGRSRVSRTRAVSIPALPSVAPGRRHGPPVPYSRAGRLRRGSPLRTPCPGSPRKRTPRAPRRGVRRRDSCADPAPAAEFPLDHAAQRIGDLA